MAAPSLPAHRFHSSEDCARAGIAVRQPAPMTLTPRKTQTTFRRMREPQSLFDFERNDDVAAKRELRTLRARTERRGAVQRGVVANLRPDNQSIKRRRDPRGLDVEAQCECAIS